MAYQVLTAGRETVITDTDLGLQVQVHEKDGLSVPANTAYCLATLYWIKGGFVPEKIYVFSNLVTGNADLPTLKKVVDFYFTTLLDTELYIKEVPPDSTLFAEEALRLYGKNEEEINDGTVSIIRPGRSE